MFKRRSLSAIALIAASAMTLAACASDDNSGSSGSTDSANTITIEDNNGTQTIQVPPTSVVALDNRTFETLDTWGVELSAAAVSLMPDTISYKKDDSIVDIGSHNEPMLELLVPVEPTLIINGQRFTQHQDAIVDLVPDAVIVNLDPREGEPLDEELKRQTEVLGEIFGKQEEAAKLIADFEAAVEKAKAAYDSSQTVMAVNVSGGEIGYIAPGIGRALGPVFDFLGLTPALEVDGASSNHQGDDISVEAIATANPAWILVMDRDAGTNAGKEPGFTPAADVLSGSEALANVTAVKNQQLVFMPTDTYTNEGIQTYTEFLEDLAAAFEAAK